MTTREEAVKAMLDAQESARRVNAFWKQECKVRLELGRELAEALSSRT